MMDLCSNLVLLLHTHQHTALADKHKCSPRSDCDTHRLAGTYSTKQTAASKQKRIIGWKCP